jgi:hypothetical protein
MLTVKNVPNIFKINILNDVFALSHLVFFIGARGGFYQKKAGLDVVLAEIDQHDALEDAKVDSRVHCAAIRCSTSA